jgi:hypothetical protein
MFLSLARTNIQAYYRTVHYGYVIFLSTGPRDQLGLNPSLGRNTTPRLWNNKVCPKIGALIRRLHDGWLNFISQMNFFYLITSLYNVSSFYALENLGGGGQFGGEETSCSQR